MKYREISDYLLQEYEFFRHRGLLLSTIQTTHKDSRLLDLGYAILDARTTDSELSPTEHTYWGIMDDLRSYISSRP